MSIKRAKSKSSGSKKDDELDPWAKPKTPEATYETHVQDKPDDAFTLYSMTSKFAKGQLIVHPKFGKGVVLETTGTSAEVVFQDGKKKLGHAG